MSGKYISNEECETAIEEILKKVAHQWRQPLSKINSNIFVIDRILRSLNIDNDAIEEKLLEIESLTKYMSMTLNDFKPKIQTDVYQTFFVQDALNQVNEIVIGIMKDSDIEFCINVRDNFILRGYFGNLVQVLAVIIYNAKDILLERNVYPAKIDVVAKKHEEAFIINVNDNGGGITKSAREKIFEPNYTTKHSSEGSGMGLNMAKQIIENHFNAKLSVQNIDKGTCFEIRFSSVDTVSNEFENKTK